MRRCLTRLHRKRVHCETLSAQSTGTLWQLVLTNSVAGLVERAKLLAAEYPQVMCVLHKRVHLVRVRRLGDLWVLGGEDLLELVLQTRVRWIRAPARVSRTLSVSAA